MFGPDFVAEEAVVRTSREYQSIVWQRAALPQLDELGTCVDTGDLVFTFESRTGKVIGG